MSGVLNWIERLLRRDPPLRLHVEGVILSQRAQVPRTHLGPTPAPEEAVFELEVERAWLSNGGERSPESIFPPTFAGPLALLDRFAVGERVRIRCTTLTGSLIDTIELVAS